jgi:hypothetical protein
MSRTAQRSFVFWLVTLSLAIPHAAQSAPITFQATGIDASAIQAPVDAFRAAIGEPNNGNAPGPLASGRREINWDGGGATTPSVVGTPFTGFLDNRGALLTTPGSGFIQASPADLALQFSNPGFETDFAAFSPLRLFTPIDSNVTDLTFFVPGSAGAVSATVSAFGAVFSDVESDATTIELFDASDLSLGSFTVPGVAGAAATFSFLGVQFDAGEQIGRVRITTGTSALGPSPGPDGEDFVVMDDFFYSEPVPEPGTLGLLAIGLAGVGALRRRSTR